MDGDTHNNDLRKALVVFGALDGMLFILAGHMALRDSRAFIANVDTVLSWQGAKAALSELSRAGECILITIGSNAHARQQALDYPTGDLILGWCPRCAFASNMLFDVSKNAYSTQYEEVQTFSPTFSNFQSELVDRLIDKHGMRGKQAIEIGCGKGEFLLELCERGENKGVGDGAGDVGYPAGCAAEN